MLQQILKDMYIDPDVLEALNEEQKKTLFLKMRQEQVRRWKEREEKLEREGGAAELTGTKPRNANGKSVSWLLGRDGDVSVLVIGEVDELTSKFISTGFGDKKSPTLQNNMQHQTTLKSQKIKQDVQNECQSDPQKTQPEVSINLKQEKREETSTLRPLPLQETVSSPTELKSLSQTPVCSRAPTRGTSVIVRTASAKPTPGSINTKSSLGNLGLAGSTPSYSTVQLDSASASTAKGTLCSKEPQKTQDSRAGKDIGALERFRRTDSAEAGKSLTAPTCTGRGRVTDLIKNFSVDNSAHSSSHGLKPPLPSKPVHLRLTTTSTVR